NEHPRYNVQRRVRSQVVRGSYRGDWQHRHYARYNERLWSYQNAERNEEIEGVAPDRRGQGVCAWEEQPLKKTVTLKIKNSPAWGATPD
ncbi:hypothetical protein SD939_10605, partial [Lactobacillus crispatus]|uniref:hypothetical protein n=1 Tax=Lactobacillus crispatus TaxID=47770 RepID=UPI0029C40031